MPPRAAAWAVRIDRASLTARIGAAAYGNRARYRAGSIVAGTDLCPVPISFSATSTAGDRPAIRIRWARQLPAIVGVKRQGRHQRVFGHRRDFFDGIALRDRLGNVTVQPQSGCGSLSWG